MTTSALTGMLDQLTARRTELRARAESSLEHAQRSGREELDARERAMLSELRGLDKRIEELKAEQARAGTHSGILGKLTRSINSAGRLAPLTFDDEQLRRAHSRLCQGESAVLETRDFSSAVSDLPAQLYDIPTFPRHEDRLLDKLPGFALEAPSLEYIQVNSVSGTAAVVGEGQPKPELTMPPTKLIIPALKLACHAGVSWEAVNDYDTWVSAVRTELLRVIVDLENHEIVYGAGGASHLSGLLSASGILTLVGTGSASTPPNHFDDIAGGIAKLRTGPALANPDLLLLHPNTWASIRTEKDTLGRYVSGDDPTDSAVETAWGVQVVQSTQFTAGEAVLLDSQLFGRVAVRESLTLRVGFSGDDFTNNIVRSVAEERLNVAVERPAAICHITGLPTAAPTQTKAAAAKK